MGHNRISIKILGSVYTGLILSVHFTSAGLLKAIREAAIPKDMDYQLPVDLDTSSSLQTVHKTSEASTPEHFAQEKKLITPAEESNLLATLQTSLSKLSSAIQERADIAKTSSSNARTCNPGDIFCLSGLIGGSSAGSTMNNEISKAIIKSFGTMMSDMVNATISRGLTDFMAHHGRAHGESLAEEQKAMIAMTSNVLQTASSAVIKSFTIFLQMAISGSMRGLLHTLLTGANNLLLKVSEVTKHNGPENGNNNENEVRAIFSGSLDKFPKPSQLQDEFDPVKTLLQAGALTSLSYPSPGFDLVTSLKSNLFTGDTNNIDRKGSSMPSLLTLPFGMINNKK